MLCIYQIFRNEFPRREGEGYGNCKICLPCKDNIYCKGFVPARLWKMEVIGDDDISVLEETLLGVDGKGN